MKGESKGEETRGKLLAEERERACLLKVSLLYVGSIINP